MEITLGDGRLLLDMALLAVMIAVGISFVFLLAYVEVELGGFYAAWRRFQMLTAVTTRGYESRSVAVRRVP
jgi:hypothetical protein